MPTARKNGLPEGLPLDSTISFRPFVSYLKEKLTGDSDTRSRIYEYLIERFEAEPALLGPKVEGSVLENNFDLLELLGTTLFPVVSEQDRNIFTLAVPYQFSLFNYSHPFGRLFVNEEEDRFILPTDASAEHLKQVQCSLIYSHVMEKFYGISLNETADLVYPVTDKASGMKRYFRLRYDRRFIDLLPKGELPDIKNCAVCLNTFRILDLEQQLKTMPLELFAAEGFGVWIAEDITTQESLEAIKKVLLRQEGCDTGIIRELKNNIHALVGLNEVEVGLSPFVKLNDQFVLDDTCARHGLMSRNWRTGDPSSMTAYHNCIEFMAAHPEPIPLSVLNEQLLDIAPFVEGLLKDGYGSCIVYPIQNNDGLLGLLELASPIPNQLNQEVLGRLEPAMPLLSLALLKHRDTFNDRIEKLIKEKFTALQPSVEWKFAEVAWEFMHSTATGNVSFENVYPLYGAVDIRNSSVERSKAIQKDLKEHLNLVDTTLDQLQEKLHLPLLEELRFKGSCFQQAIEQGLQAEDEIRISEFFANQVRPMLDHLQKSNPGVKDMVDSYERIVNDSSGYLYKFRNEYETSISSINEAVLEYLEKEEEMMQQSYPHYFEKYKTDGVEYTIYIGQSISPGRPFDMIYLRNIRLWQLRSLAEIARMANRLAPSLPVPLQTTQLVLVHSQPISISFRRDERRFDVEGSYNVRYEVMKKRLDKAFIRGTTERLTQPGKIAMVYSNPKEAQEYEEYIGFLQSKQLLVPGLEYLELEELQGVSGLKALRVTVDLGQG